MGFVNQLAFILGSSEQALSSAFSICGNSSRNSWASSSKRRIIVGPAYQSWWNSSRLLDFWECSSLQSQQDSEWLKIPNPFFEEESFRVHAVTRCGASFIQKYCEGWGRIEAVGVNRETVRDKACAFETAERQKPKLMKTMIYHLYKIILNLTFANQLICAFPNFIFLKEILLTTVFFTLNLETSIIFFKETNHGHVWQNAQIHGRSSTNCWTIRRISTSYQGYFA